MLALGGGLELGMARKSKRMGALGERLMMVACLALANASGHAQTGLVLDDFHEQFDPEVKTSANTIAGVMFLPTATSMAIEPQVSLPPGLPAELARGACMQVRSRDGRYFAEGSIGQSALSHAGASPRIRFKTAHRDALEELGPLDLGIVLRAGSCGSAGSVPAFYVVDRSTRSTAAPTGVTH